MRGCGSDASDKPTVSCSLPAVTVVSESLFAELPQKRAAPTFASMRGGWRSFGLFVAAAISLVAVVSLATRDQERATEIVALQAAFIAAMAYLITFVVWPRRVPRSEAHPSYRKTRTAVPNEPSPELDERPVAVIGNRPAGSKPGSRVHVAEVPTSRGTRGRRPDNRQPSGEIRWPAQR